MTDNFLPSRLDGVFDPGQPLEVLGDELPWTRLETSISPIFDHKISSDETDTGFDFDGEFITFNGGDVSTESLAVGCVERRIWFASIYPPGNRPLEP